MKADLDFMYYLERGMESVGVELDSVAKSRFEIYKDMLVDWNEKMNLTGITDDEGIAVKHFVDSLGPLHKLKSFMPQGGRLIDVGSGAGFPGLPLKIARPDMEVTLLDSLAKRLKFLDAVIEKGSIEGIKTVHFRAEDGARDKGHREKYDTAVARAVAPLSVLLEYCIPYLKVGGYFLAFKSSKLDDEIKESQKALKELGAVVEDVISFEISTSGEGIMERKIAIIKKISKTKSIYPRKAGTPGKSPIS